MYQLDTSSSTFDTTDEEVRRVAKRSDVLEFAVLGLLHESPMHGYELRKRLNATLGAFRAFSYGSLYPCLKTLLAAGLVTEQAAAAGGPPASGPGSSTSSRPRARSTSPSLLDESGPSAWEDEGFGVHFAFFGRTDAQTRAAHPRGPPHPARGAPRRLPRRARAHPRAARRLHPRAAAARPGVRRARGALAERADRRRAAPPRVTASPDTHPAPHEPGSTASPADDRKEHPWVRYA